jgi:hypothetical protein
MYRIDVNPSTTPIWNNRILSGHTIVLSPYVLLERILGIIIATDQILQQFAHPQMDSGGWQFEQ